MKVSDGKPLIRRVGEKGKDVQGIEDIPETGALHKIVQTGQGRAIFSPKQITISGKDHILFGKTVLRIKPLFVVDHFLRLVGVVYPENSFQLKYIFFSLCFAVKKPQSAQHPLPCFARDFQERPRIVRLRIITKSHPLT